MAKGSIEEAADNAVKVVPKSRASARRVETAKKSDVGSASGAGSDVAAVPTANVIYQRDAEGKKSEGSGLTREEIFEISSGDLNTIEDDSVLREILQGSSSKS